MKGDNGDTAGEKRDKPWLPFVIIIAASALAHLWCLGSQFYMDDMPQIRDNEIVRSGHFWEMRFSAWTYLGYVIQDRLFGMSAVGFHAVNWLLHTAVACVVFAFGRDFLRDRWPAGVAWFGALLFSVHPLASEIPNYVRTQDLAWVTLFSLLAAWALVRYLRDGGGWKLAGCAICIASATISKGPGLFHALMATGAVGLAVAQPAHWSLLRRNIRWVAGVVVIGISALWLMGLLNFGHSAIHQWSNPRFVGHGYTISRVFWEFAWRSVIPLGLSSDHHIAETLIPAGSGFLNIPDKVAMLAAAGMLALAGFSVFLAWRRPTRLFGVCLFLYVATILFRVFYLIPEFMPEYRIYPGLPWFCLGAAILLASVWKYLFETMSPRVPAVILLGVLAFLSARRSFLWHDLDKLTADVLKQYPANARVLWELNDRSVATKNWQAIIDRQTTMWPEIERQFVQQNQRLAPAREIPSGHFVLAMVAIHGRYARAIAHTQNPAAGLRVMAQLEAHMKRMQMTPENKALEWGYFYRDKALILEAAGNYQAALDCLKREKEKDPQPWPQDFERISKKLAAAKPGP